MMPAVAFNGTADDFVDHEARAAELRAAIASRCSAKAQMFVKSAPVALSTGAGRTTLSMTLPVGWSEWREAYGDEIYKIGSDLGRQLSFVFRIHRQPVPRVVALRGGQ